MWSDNETTEDLLGFKVHADLLIDVIKDDSILPITIGVFGDWGSGKSSILKMVHEELAESEEGTFVMYFNGWLFEGYDDAKAALLESILKEFEENIKFGPKVKKKVKELRKSVNWMRVLGFGFKNVAVPAAATFVTGGASLAPYLAKKIGDLKPEDLVNKLQSKETEGFLESIIKDNGDEDNSMLVREFRDEFKNLIKESKIDKLVVVIDDLDRCTPDRIIENLEAIKLFLNVEKTAFIIGADSRIVRHAIELRYKTDGIEKSDDPNSRNRRIVSDYLEKLIQVPYNLPKLSDNEVETYMTLLFCKKELGSEFEKVLTAFWKYRETDRYGTFGIGNLEGVISPADYASLGTSFSLLASLSSIITEGLNGNPRQIKRFLNTFTLRNRLIKVAKIPDFRVDVLAKLMVLEYSSPHLFKSVYEWQSIQQGEPKEFYELETEAAIDNLEGIRESFTADWSNKRMVDWLKVEPQLSGIDLRDYYWISRDQLTTSISGSSLISGHIRLLFKKLVEHGSGSILEKVVRTEVLTKLSELDLESLYSLLSKELSKFPSKPEIHKVYIELISQKVTESINSYTNIIKQVDHKKVPFSLRGLFQLAEKKNPEIGTIYGLFDMDSQIYKALKQKK